MHRHNSHDRNQRQGRENIRPGRPVAFYDAGVAAAMGEEERHAQRRYDGEIERRSGIVRPVNEYNEVQDVEEAVEEEEHARPLSLNCLGCLAWLDDGIFVERELSERKDALAGVPADDHALQPIGPQQFH